ncbi:hypothetical protein [Citrobacter freundii]|uniref:hypothetical protein n=1 Tax=Citrobacter freundii TaxID=546 RepID=UPI001FFE1F34|nr:hypothetical protein [Citrobacter freundii]MDE9644316.1 hypothetical protein [Citrobacter freundii]MDE9696454.1 hypothetical protein [Citrobacter freundii]MDT7338948.1 hypothetical protein [Citrobacter freundii]MDT7391759.1 hypothetical protein [Citrobacter freundii]MDT7395880.1 hypothetical protein [Citrobacter freundii]
MQAVADLKAGYTLGHADVEILNDLARIALASLEAEPGVNHQPVAWQYKEYVYVSGLGYLWREKLECEFPGAECETLKDVVPLYTAPPAQVAPDEMTPQQASRSYGGEVRGYRDGWNACRAAMLQGADGTLTNEGTIPVTQFKPVADLYGLTSPTGGETSFTFDAVEARDFIDGGWLCQEYVTLERYQETLFQGAKPVTTAYKLPFEQWLSQQTGTIDVECGCVMTEVFFHWLRVAYEAGNSPVIPDGWALVPVEPTEDMIVNGFESEPDESFSDEKEWEAYDAMSGCQQAAHRAKLCWAAMISAAPKPDAR